MKKHIFPIAITGHMDHGKSTLIGRLLLETNSLPEEKIKEIKKISKELGKDTELAYVCDQLKEERENNMTIDTTQIFFNTRKRSYCIIDTPGHVEFLKNMITGTSHAEAAVLIIDANEGIMEQTRRHLYVIAMLGIKQLVIVVNKMDLVDYNEQKFNWIKEELLAFLGRIGLQGSIIIPISARENDNISKKSVKTKWYRGATLLDTLDDLKEEETDEAKPLTLAVQDVYNMDGKNIIVGMVSSGRLLRGGKITILPDKRDTEAESILEFGEKNKKEAFAGENVGIILKDSLSIKRGDIIIEKQGPLQATTSFKGDILWLSEEPLEINKKFILRCVTQEVACVVERIEKRMNTSTLEMITGNSNELKINEAAQLLFRTEKPVVVESFSFIERFGRFAVEKDHALCGLGIVV
ncbi:MAG: GTP-binding protein [Candidatus Omnitrophica bacterium]|nr:GTP-binding protein [Candidatus Omnitrophota bacterium]